MAMKILAIGAHPDDIELGISGTLYKHIKHGDSVHALICSTGGVDNNPKRLEEARAGAKIIGIDKLTIWDYPVAKLNKVNQEFVLLLKRFIDDIKPDRVYVHSMYDRHQVHLTINKSTINAAKHIKQLIFYESLSSTTQDFKPNAYVDITYEIDTKIKSIKAHKTQYNKIYMHEKPIRSLANYRYIQGKVGNNPKGYAEAFIVHTLKI
jgi:LmbE family N-acetylglucosaminyl deacetylase